MEITIDQQKLLWLDIETTGLRPKSDQILAIGIAITDKDLKIVEEREWFIKHKNLDLNMMNLEVLKMHVNSGLLDQVRRATTGLNDVWEHTKEILQKHYKPDERVIVAGNSVHFDRQFIREHMNPFYATFFYRQVDVSSVKLLVEAWMPDKVLEKTENKHLPLSDIHNSIEELKYYRKLLFGQINQ